MRATAVKAGFWHERWEANQLGFHQAEVNGLLKDWWPALGLASDAAVFVPLCGKSLDMTWLRSQGHPVVGIEVSPIAVRDFFVESSIEAAASSNGRLERFEGGGYRLYRGDFFDLEDVHLAEIRGVYDRASLIALPPEMRSRYAKHLCAILPPKVRILLISIEYDQSKMSGPPHSVAPSEVEALFGAAFEIELRWSSGEQLPTDRFRERGLESWSESVWQLSRGAHD